MQQCLYCIKNHLHVYNKERSTRDVPNVMCVCLQQSPDHLPPFRLLKRKKYFLYAHAHTNTRKREGVRISMQKSDVVFVCVMQLCWPKDDSSCVSKFVTCFMVNTSHDSMMLENAASRVRKYYGTNNVYDV